MELSKRPFRDQCPRCANLMGFDEGNNLFICPCGMRATPEFLKDFKGFLPEEARQKLRVHPQFKTL